MPDQEHPKAIEDLIRDLRDEDQAVQWRAAEVLGQSGDARAVEPLIEALSHQGKAVRWRAAAALGKLGDARAVEPLIDALRHQGRDVRNRAAEALGKLGDIRAVESLVEALRDHGDAGDAAAKALGQLGAPAVDALIGALHDENADARRRAAEVLGQIRDARAVEALIEALHDEDAAVREASSWALVRIGAPAVEPLVEALRDENAAVREKASWALRRIGPSDLTIIGASSGFRDALEAEARRPRFSAFYPAVVKPDLPYALMTFVHLQSALAQVRAIAAGYTGAMGDQQASGTAESRVGVDVGNLITFVPQVPGIRFSPAETIVPWQPPHQSATFLFTTPADPAASLAGRVAVYQGPLLIGEIPIHMQLETADVPVPVALNQQDPIQLFDPIFASYSHRDTPVMEYFRRARETMGQRMLVDIYELRAGEHWADRLLEMINRCAVFQLFWSEHSAQSPYCRQEWQHALKFDQARPRFIQPVWWNAPMPAPPPELADLHFQRVTLSPLTRMQLALAKLRH